MQISKELLASELGGLNEQLENSKALLNRQIGAISVVMQLQKVLEQPEPVAPIVDPARVPDAAMLAKNDSQSAEQIAAQSVKAE